MAFPERRLRRLRRTPALRRLVATGKADDLAACVALVAATKGEVRLKALEGLTEGLKGRTVDAPPRWVTLQAELIADARWLSSIWS